MKHFNKGDRVTLVQLWSRTTGAFYSREAVVYSCGAKQMVLTDAETGVEIGRNFRPEPEQYGDGIVIKTPGIAAAREMALAMSADWLVAEIERKRNAIERTAAQGYSSPGYVKAMQDDIDNLLKQVPSHLTYAEGRAIVEKAVAERRRVA